MFRENNIEYERVNYFNDALTEDKLRDLLKKANLAPFEILRKSEKIYQELNLSEAADSDKLIKLIIEHPNLLQRPIVEVGDHAVLARPIEKALELIKSAR
ncbi:MAG: hypothetical protein LH614_03465 [Pyrinomonadaceae bacterium]|nr:hypothetical protein [Pyrinomonadaceae bacterium]